MVRSTKGAAFRSFRRDYSTNARIEKRDSSTDLIMRFNAGLGPAGSWADVAVCLRGMPHRRQLIRRTGANINLIRGKTLKSGQVEHLYCSNDKAKELLSWQPSVDLKEGLQRTIDSFR